MLGGRRWRARGEARGVVGALLVVGLPAALHGCQCSQVLYRLWGWGSEVQCRQHQCWLLLLGRGASCMHVVSMTRLRWGVWGLDGAEVWGSGSITLHHVAGCWVGGHLCTACPAGLQALHAACACEFCIGQVQHRWLRAAGAVSHVHLEPAGSSWHKGPNELRFTWGLLVYPDAGRRRFAAFKTQRLLYRVIYLLPGYAGRLQ